jgi:hypothetical protein
MKFRNFIVIAGMTALFAAWIAVGVGFVLEVERQTWVILVVIAAVATEAMMWCMAAAFGLTVLQARRQIWRRLRSMGATDNIASSRN